MCAAHVYELRCRPLVEWGPWSQPREVIPGIVQALPGLWAPCSQGRGGMAV